MPTDSGPELPQSASSVKSVQLNSIEDLQQRLAKVEELLGVNQEWRSSEASHVELPVTSPALHETKAGQSYQSHQYGEDARVTLLNQVRL